METGANGLQLRVRDLVRKFRPERVRWQLRHLLASVDQHWPPTIISTSSSSVDQIWPSATTDSTTTGPTDTAATATEAINPPFDNNIQKVVVVECEPQQTAESCLEQSPDQPMSTQVSVASPEEDPGRNGSVRPSELSIPVVGGSLVPPTASLTPRNKSPVTVQEWVDSLPLTPSDVTRGEEESEPRIVLTQDTDDNLTLGAEAGLMCGPLPPAVQVTSCREPSESGSHCSSVESLLEARKPDPEEVLLSLGFGGNSTSECRIPQRFLQPSRLRGVAIDDFLRHQHEMVQNFETGFCGYRGLSGPSHTMPSVIVAKIMEKLREHERESSAAASPPLASTNTDRNKFSRVARNVLTKIKCVPGNSVLTPDNRAWLDSQGHKSPEIGRKRIIIGQQSFTFSNDGDLIESQSPPSSLTDSDSRWTSSTGPGHHKTDLALDKPCVFPSIQEDLTEPPLPPTTTTSAPVTPKHAFANVVTTLLAEKHQESKLSSSSIEVSEEDKHWTRSLGDSGLPSSGRSSRGLEDCDSPVNLTDDKHSAPEPEHQTTVEGHLDSINEEVKPPREVVVEQSINPTTDVNEDSASDKVQQVLENLNSIPPNVTEFLNGKSKTLNVLNSHINISNKHVSLGLVDKTNSLDSAVENSSVAGRLLPASEQTSLPSSERSTLTTSPWPSLASELEQATAEEAKLESLTNCDVTSGEVSSPTAVRTEPLSAPGRVIESLDKVIESLEKIMEPLEVITESDNHMSAAVISQANRVKLLHSYDDLRLLVEQLLEVGVSLDVGSSDQFLSLTINERCALQSRVVRQALSAYQAQLASDSSHYQLKCCLGTEVLRLSDLLDSAADPDKLSTLVQQMTELLKHQAELSELLRSSVHEPHQLCEVVLRRLRALEDVVRRNTRDLTDLRKHV